jgi:ABC exporter DevB family membrane fusion protein
VARLVAILLLGVLLGAGASWVLQAFRAAPAAEGRRLVTTDRQLPHRDRSGKRAVHAQGTLEPRGGPVLVTSALVGTPIRQILVPEGQEVERGTVVIELDPTVPEEELRIVQSQRAQAMERQQTEMALAKQRLEAATQAVEQAQAARGLELETQKSQVAAAEAKLEQANVDLARMRRLETGERPLVSAQQVEHQRTAVKLAKAEHEAAAAALNRVEQTLRFNLQKAETEKKGAEEAVAIASRGTAIVTLERQISLAEHKLKQTQVVAPAGGTVIRILAHRGELVSTQPLMQIANLDALECLAEVDVADLPLLKDRHEAFISCRAFRGTKIKAEIERIRNVAGAATLRPVDPRKSVDRTVATVVLKVDAAEAAKLLGGSVQDAGSALMGLQVEVEIPLEGSGFGVQGSGVSR